MSGRHRHDHLIPGRTQYSVSVYIVQSLCQTPVSNAAWAAEAYLCKSSHSFSYRLQLWTPLTSSVVNDFLSCGWPRVGTNLMFLLTSFHSHTSYSFNSTSVMLSWKRYCSSCALKCCTLPFSTHLRNPSHIVVTGSLELPVAVGSVQLLP